MLLLADDDSHSSVQHDILSVQSFGGTVHSSRLDSEDFRMTRLSSLGTAELDTLKLELKGAQVCDTATLRKLVEAQAMINANIERTVRL